VKRIVLGSLGLSLLVLGALACGSAPPGGAGTSAPPGGAVSSPPQEGGPSAGAPQGGGEQSAAGPDVACQTDADCAVVQTACCDHCNGGKAEAYNKAHADKHRAQGCNVVACTMRACGEAVAVCANNACRLEIKQLVP
jgi:hypothetical protein